MDNGNIEFYILALSTKSETFLLKIGEYLYTDDIKEITRRSYFLNRHCQTVFNICYYVYSKTNKLASLRDAEFIVNNVYEKEPEKKRDILDVVKDVYAFDEEINWEIIEDEALKFVKDRKFIEALSLSQKDMDEKNYAAVIERLEKSTQVSFDSDYGADITDWNSVKKALSEITDSSESIPTGYSVLDSEKIYNGGVRRKELHVIAANSGIGKTLFMNNIALNMAIAGKNVVYISFETSTARIMARMLANLMDSTTASISYSISENEDEVRKEWEKHVGIVSGKLFIKEFPSGTMNTNQITTFLLDMQKNIGFKVDAVFCDYLGIMVPCDKKLSKESMYAYDGAIAVDLRRMAYDLDCVVYTGAQINREGLKDGATKETITTENLAESMAIEHTADSILTLSQDVPHRNKKQLVCFVAKNRNAVKGQRMTLQLNDNCRLTEVL